MRWKALFVVATMIKIIFVLLAFSGIAKLETVLGIHRSNKSGNELFRSWMKLNNKNYGSKSEYEKRQEIFNENQILIEKLNKKQKEFGSDVEFALNHFADMTTKEFQRKVLMPKQSPIRFSDWHKINKISGKDLPLEFDWRNTKAVGEVRDQGGAGTCWAFSTVQAVEGQWALKTGVFTELSVEQVVDCDATHDNKNHADCGVFGGWPFLAYEYIKKEGGLEKESDYPYCCGLGGDKGTCYVCPAKGYNKTLCGPPAEYCKKSDSCDAKLNRSLFVSGLKVAGWSAISDNETEIAKALVSKGPLSIAIDASTLQFYRRGIWDPIFCDPKSLDHAVLLTGYGKSKQLFQTKPYWTVKNSWGKKWGEDGYFRIARNKGKCGMNTQVTIPNLQ